MKRILGRMILFLAVVMYSVTGTAKTTYKIGCIDDYYPYITMNNNGELEGIIIDWWNLWSLKTGVEIEFVQLNIQDCINKTQSGEIDAIAGLFYSDERAETLDYSESLMRMRTVLYLKKGIKTDSVQNISEVINLVEKSLSHDYLKQNYPDLKLKIFNSFSSLIKEISLQNADGFTYDIPNPIGNYKDPIAPKGYYAFETLFAERLRPAVNKGNSDLLNLLIAGASKITDEELTVIAEKWKLFKKDRTLLYIILGVGFVLLIVIAFLVNYSIKIKRKAKNLADFESKTDWQVIIDKGENDLIEFKSSLRWDYRRQKMNKALEGVIAKTISAFLNTKGGMLFIGVDDDGNALGLDNDYQSMSKNNRDGFLLTLTSVINQSMGKDIHKFITINIISLNEKDVCIVNVEKSDKPIFIGTHEREKFYIRASASSQPLGLSEVYKYINSHWEK